MKYLKFILAVAIIAGLIGCDILDTQEPQQSLPTDEVIDDPAGLENLVTGLYDGLQEADISGGNFNVLPEIMADNVNWTGSFTNYARQASKNMQPDDGQIEDWWDTSYREINTANVLLQAIEEIDDPTFSEADRELIRAEAHFARGMLYFELARVYAKPWGFTTDNSHLAVAANLLPDVAVRGDRRATRYAALGYLKRLYLEQGDYETAADYAGQIIDSGLFSLTDTPGGPFENEFSSESIFEIIHTPQDNPGVNAGQNAFYTDTDRGGRGDIQFTSDYTNALASTVTEEQQAEIDAAGYSVIDTRENLIDRNPDRLSTLKFTDGVNNADNVINMRYAGVLLSRAETLVETAAFIADVPQEAYDHLNNIRTRSISVTDEDGVDFSELIEFEPGDFNSRDEMMDAILLERRVELSFEGDRFYTLKRKGLPIDGFQPDDNRITFPIPQGEMDANPNMVQNEGY